MAPKPPLMRILLLLMALGLLVVGATAAADQAAADEYEGPARAPGSAGTYSYYVSGCACWLHGPACLPLRWLSCLPLRWIACLSLRWLACLGADSSAAAAEALLVCLCSPIPSHTGTVTPATGSCCCKTHVAPLLLLLLLPAHVSTHWLIDVLLHRPSQTHSIVM
jgi:hypothetical protein